MSLHISKVPSQRGVAWVGESVALFVKNPFGFSLLFMLFLVAALVLMALPFVGALLLLAAMPLLTLGFAAATRAAKRGETVHAGLLFEPFRAGDAQRRGALLRLCVLYAGVTALVMLLAQSIDGGGFERLQILLAAERTKANQAEIDSLLGDPRLSSGMLVRATLIAALSVPFWHAPMLVWWHGQGIGQALFSSTLACWRNRGAYVINVFVWLGIGAAFGVLAGALIALLGVPQLVAVVLPPAVLMFSVVFYVSLYLMYADCFAADVPPIRQSST